MAKIELVIEGMHCGACVRRAGQALGALEGVTVEEVRVGAARIHTTDEAADGQAATAAAIAALAKVGYTARGAE
jgi:copper chaperone